MLRLLLDGWCRPHKDAADEAASLIRLGWVRQERGGVTPISLAEIRGRLERVAPGLENAALAARASGYKPFERAGHRMAARTGQSTLQLPPHLSRKVAGAVLKPHSKHSLSDAEAAAGGVLRLLGDGLFRVRSTISLTVTDPDGVSAELGMQTKMFGEAALPERFLDRCSVISGRPDAVIMVENPGAFTEMPIVLGSIAVLVPGTDVSAARLLRLLPGVPVFHFGDWDQKGRESSERVQMTAAAVGSPFFWVCPDWLEEYTSTHAMKVPNTPWKAPFGTLPAPVRNLAERGLWIEQEAVTLDPRLAQSMSP